MSDIVIRNFLIDPALGYILQNIYQAVGAKIHLGLNVFVSGDVVEIVDNRE
ncbi:MAG: hypothetical protein LBJ71_00470 [Holosporaceae bacterium]|nr:hypothetical protein [Holosporaceae bacterium]